jgi:hypothetical protein
MTDDEARAATERELKQTKLRLDDAVSAYSQGVQLGRKERAMAGQELHRAVIKLWWKMRPYLKADGDTWADLTEYEGIDRNFVWHGTHPQTGDEVAIIGLRDLRDWMDKTGTATTQNASPLSSRGSDTRSVQMRLPAPAAMSVAEILTERFHAFGWTAERDRGLQGQEGFDATETRDQPDVQRRSREEMGI